MDVNFIVQIGLFSVKWIPVGETVHVTDFMFAQARNDMLFICPPFGTEHCVYDCFCARIMNFYYPNLDF